MLVWKLCRNVGYDATLNLRTHIPGAVLGTELAVASYKEARARTTGTLIAVGLIAVVTIGVVFLMPPVGADDNYYSVTEALRSPRSVKKLVLIRQNLTQIPEAVRQLHEPVVLRPVRQQNKPLAKSAHAQPKDRQAIAL